MHRRVQLALILTLTMALSLGALPPLRAPAAVTDQAGTAAVQSTEATAAAQADEKAENRAGSLLAEFDMPFFSFAGITRPRL